MRRELTDRQLEKLVEMQIGRPAAIGFRAAAWCGYGWPSVIRNAPFTRSQKPNPNLYYLSCPYLRYETAVLEDRGYIREVERAAGLDEALAGQLRAAQKRHAEEWRKAAGGKWLTDSSEGPRIAAASGDLAIKCLHAHLAWYLVKGESGVGRMIMDEIGEPWCPDEVCSGYDIGR